MACVPNTLFKILCIKTLTFGVPLWHSGLRIQYCHCSILSPCLEVQFVAWELLHTTSMAKNQPTKQTNKKTTLTLTGNYKIVKVITPETGTRFYSGGFPVVAQWKGI